MSRTAARRIAVVLFNLGGPDGPAAVRPFLFNLFRDPAIIAAPTPVRLAIAALISTLRAKSARANYALMGGGSPLLPETQKQSDALQASLSAALPSDVVQSFIAMRYWRPFTDQTAADVAAFEPTDVILLPLYPQFSTTTTESSAKIWREQYKGPGEVHSICCYPTAEGLVAAHAAAIERAFDQGGRPEKTRLLFSAHGLPESVLRRGDPYKTQIEATAAAVADKLGPSWDWQVCYQSRVGPMKWIGPSTSEAIEKAAEEGLGVLVTPIAFVSEHIETLVELDDEYAKLATEKGCRHFLRAPALGIDTLFIEALRDASLTALHRPGPAPFGAWTCPAEFGACPHRRAA